MTRRIAGRRPGLGLLALALLTACGGGGGGRNPAGPDAEPPPQTVQPFDFGPNDPFRVTAFGDSITLGVLDEGLVTSRSYPAVLQGMLRGLDARYRVINRGVGGEVTAQGLPRFPGVLARDRPGYVLIMEGTNDADFGEDADSVLRNLERMVDLAQRNHTIPVLGTIPPNFRTPSFPQVTIRIANERIRTLARTRGVVLAEIFDGMNDRSLFGDPRRGIEDPLHPNERGYAVMAGIWFAAMQQAIRPAAPPPLPTPPPPGPTPAPTPGPTATARRVPRR